VNAVHDRDRASATTAKAALSAVPTLYGVSTAAGAISTDPGGSSSGAQPAAAKQAGEINKRRCREDRSGRIKKTNPGMSIPECY
jgi:hypothetical protein